MASCNLNVRVDAGLKADAENCLKDMGLTMSSAIVIYLKQIVKRRAIPFAIAADPVPNKETADAIAEGERIATDPTVRGYGDMNSLIEALNS